MFFYLILGLLVNSILLKKIILKVIVRYCNKKGGGWKNCDFLWKSNQRDLNHKFTCVVFHTFLFSLPSIFDLYKNIITTYSIYSKTIKVALNVLWMMGVLVKSRCFLSLALFVRICCYLFFFMSNVGTVVKQSQLSTMAIKVRCRSIEINSCFKK